MQLRMWLSEFVGALHPPTPPLPSVSSLLPRPLIPYFQLDKLLLWRHHRMLPSCECVPHDKPTRCMLTVADTLAKRRQISLQSKWGHSHHRPTSFDDLQRLGLNPNDRTIESIKFTARSTFDRHWCVYVCWWRWLPKDFRFLLCYIETLIWEVLKVGEFV